MPKAAVCVLTGTGVTRRAAFWYYSGLLNLTETGALFSLPKLGLFTDLDHCYQELAQKVERWLVRAGIESVHLIGHSQGGDHALRFGLEHPEIVESAVLVSPPLGGTQMAPRWVPGLPAIAGLAYDSKYARFLMASFADHPHKSRFHSIWTATDGFVWPTRSSYLPGAHNVLLAPSMHHERLAERLPADVEMIDSTSRPWLAANHLTEIWYRPLVGLIDGIINPAELPKAA